MTLCERCGEALDMEVWQRPADGLLCAPCRQKLPEFERAVAYGVYAGELREMVHLLKFERMAGIARPLGQRLAEAIAQIESVAAKEMVVIPVPLYPVKERRRGYNQAVLLAEAAINELKRRNNGWSLKLERSWLRRVKDTESQFALTPRQRGLNLRGAFEVKNGGALKNREVLLVDDIYTTGATVRECALTLKHAGALKVWVATVARAQLEMVEMWNGD
jgi:ComF family protein